ncbi:hypothetical protein RUMOBE_02051 [Blautia obeum ATCC 29174]|uniref:Uncharacterized protein n=1 Tax=Blautia obeum ATCC 29174 TaxID=411459 RepID=A5ZSS3_9FIRM|nr:hypothetical protein RUMOBE_02051 [Blautia obeum ATCC 29174]
MMTIEQKIQRTGELSVLFPLLKRFCDNKKSRKFCQKFP